MNREHIQTQETKLPELHKKTVKLENYGEGVWVDTTIGPADIQLGNANLRLYGRDVENGTIDGQEVPDNWLGVVTQPDNQHLAEGMGYAPIVRSDDGSFFGLDLGRDKPGCEAFDFDLSVSENHAAIVPDPDVDGQFMIVDTGSKNGTAVTGIDFREDDTTTREQDIDLSAVMALDLDSLVSNEEVASITPETVRGHNQEETEFLQSAIESFKPVAGVELNSGTIYVSEPFKVAAPHEGSEYSLAFYRDDDDKFSPLWFRKDSAEYGVAGNGEWRLSGPIVSVTEHDPFRGWGKYQPHDSDASNRLVEEVENTLAYVEAVTYDSTPEPIDMGTLTELQLASGDIGNIPSVDDIAEVTKIGGLGVDSVKTKQGFGSANIAKARYEIQNMQLPDGLEPDFSGQPVKTYGLNHEVFGMSQVEVFRSEFNSRPVVWHVASSHDRIWLYRLEFEDSETTVAGTQQDVIDGGALTLKPIEHVSFEGYWGEVGVDWNGLPEYPGYGDMKPTIDSMPWVRHYRQAKQAQERPTSAERTAIS